MSVRLLVGDCLERLAELPGASIETIITDPPYGLTDLRNPEKSKRGFMGKTWDAAVPGPEYWQACWRVAKPGAYALVFGGTRTWHRLACALEDAGWILVDTLMWMYGQGMPKSLDIGKAFDRKAGAKRPVVGRYQPPGMAKPWNLRHATDKRTVTLSASSRNNLDTTALVSPLARQWQGWGTGLKPAWNPILVVMKPLVGNYTRNARQFGVAGFHIDGARLPTTENLNGGAYSGESREKGGGWQSEDRAGGKGSGFRPGAGAFKQPSGRWPPNVAHDGSPDVLQHFPNAPGQMAPSIEDGKPQGNKVFGAMRRGGPHHEPRSDQGGSAARFMYCAKATTRERGEGCDHTTVKPLALMEWLCRLTKTPTGGTVLDPFCGSGTTLIAARLTGRSAIGIEIDPHYAAIAERRLRKMGLWQSVREGLHRRQGRRAKVSTGSLRRRLGR